MGAVRASLEFGSFSGTQRGLATGTGQRMKLASYKDGSRDGQLVVVSRDLTRAHYATGVAHTLRQVLDDWSFLSPQLQDLSVELNLGKGRHAFAFDAAQCMAPLPRATQMLWGAAYPSHHALRQETEPAAYAGRGAALQRRLPRLVQLAADDLLGPLDPVVCRNEGQGLDFEAGWVALMADVPMGCTPARALDAVRLLALAQVYCLRDLEAIEQAEGVGAVQSRPATALSPVVVTPDELGVAWSQGRISLTLQSTWNGRRLGLCEAGADMGLHLGQVVAQAAATRRLRAGALVGTGTVSNAGVAQGGALSWPRGCHSLVEKRAMEVLQHGRAATVYLRWGDRLGLDMKGADGQSVFGSLEQLVAEAEN